MSDRFLTNEKRAPAESLTARQAAVILVVDGERLERELTVTHLRKLGFDAIEAANGFEAHCVLNSVNVDVAVVDLATLGRANEPDLLERLRERQGTIKIIVASDADIDMATLGPHIFLSKPYSMVILVSCIEKVLAAPQVQTGRTKNSFEPRTVRSDPGQAQPQGPTPKEVPAAKETQGAKREPTLKAEVQRRLALSLQLAQREGRYRAVDPAAAKAAHRAALLAYERVRAGRLKLVEILALVATVGITYLVPTFGLPYVPSSPNAGGLPVPASPAATAMPSSASSVLPSPPSQAASIAPAPADMPLAAEREPSPSGQKEPAALEAPLVPPVTETFLQREEVRELQMRLRSFGFNPGPVDGAPGPMTESAVRDYQLAREQPQTGKLDRELLGQLRQDPAPKVTQRAPRPASRRDQDATTSPSPGPRPFDPFAPVRAAGDRLGQWLDSLVR